MIPTVGRIVHYSTLNGEVFPALVTRVHDTERESVALTVFRDDGTSMGISRSRRTNATPGTDSAFGCWTWPEHADDIGVKLPVADTTGTLPNAIFPADSIDALKAENDRLKADLAHATKQTSAWIKAHNENVQFITDTILARGAGKYEGLVNFVDRIVKERDEAVKSKNGADDLCRAACVAADTAQTENAKLKQRIADLERHSAALNDQCVQQQIALSGIRAVFQQHDAPGAK